MFDSNAASHHAYPPADDRRRYRRVPVALLGRYMLPNREEYACQTIDMSPGGVSVRGPVQGAVGERVVVYLEHLGRIEGEIARLITQGFALSIAATARKRDKLASQLTWLANRAELGLPEDRRHERLTPRNPVVDLRMEDGATTPVRLIDISLSGAAISTDHPMPLEARLWLGETRCKVVRRFQGGMAVEFLLPLSPDRFDENIVL